MGSAVSIRNLPEALTEEDCKALAGDKYRRSFFKRLSIDGELKKETLARFLLKVDAYFLEFWRDREPTPEVHAQLRLVRNMVFSYGITVWMPEDMRTCEPGSSAADDRTLDDGMCLVIFVTLEFFSEEPLFTFEPRVDVPEEEEEAERAVGQRVARMQRDFEEMQKPVYADRFIAVVLESDMLDRSKWSSFAQQLLASASIVDMTGGFVDSARLSAAVVRLCDAITQLVEVPVMKHPIKSIAVKSPYVPLPQKRKSILGRKLSISAMQNIVLSEVNPGDIKNEVLLPRIYERLAGGDWTDNAHWCTDAPMDSWFGVVWKDGNPSKLTLSRNNLVGAFPLEICGLRFLRSLNLSHNQLAGEIPAALSKLRLLRVLYLSHNHFEGLIPHELGLLADILELGLNDNQLEGDIPPAFASCVNLLVLDLSNNQLSGEVPAQLGSLKRLRSLYLHCNEFTGSIPPSLGYIEDLIVLSLHHNKLSGNIPSSFGKLKNLEQLHLQSNALFEAIPKELTTLLQLTQLNLADNKLTGVVLRELAALTKLTELRLENNQLIGVVPKNFSELKNLEILSMHNNKLAGAIPQDLGFMQSLRSLHLGLNKLAGKIPVELSLLTQLTELALNNNKLTGEIPKELSVLTQLTELRLNDNEISSCEIRGAIPPELGQLVNLEVLCLHNNRLTGAIPYELSHLARLKEIYLSGNRLSGTLADLQYLLPTCEKIFL